MTDWAMAAKDFRKALAAHSSGCYLCRHLTAHGQLMFGAPGQVYVSDRCREGAMLLSEVVIADVHAECEALKKIHAP